MFQFLKNNSPVETGSTSEKFKAFYTKINKMLCVQTCLKIYMINALKTSSTSCRSSRKPYLIEMDKVT